MIPFMTPPYIGSMGWILFMQPNGYFEQFFPMLKTVSSSFFSLGGMVLIMSLHLFPFLYFMLKTRYFRLGVVKKKLQQFMAEVFLSFKKNNIAVISIKLCNGCFTHFRKDDC